MATPKTPEELNEAAKCFNCLQEDHKEAVKLYLLASINGGSMDPQTLLAAACQAGFTCVQPDHVKAMENYLLAQILAT